MDEIALSQILGLILTLGIYWAIYAFVLFLLMRLQGWRVGPVPLLVSTGLATLVAQIPVFGPFFGTAVLALCIWKASRSPLRDSLLSVVIAGALMFAFQVFALTALMTRLGIAPIGEGASKAKRVIEVAAAVSWNAGGGEPLLYFKGITVSSNGLMVLVGSGTENYSFTAGEMGAVDSPKGRLIVKCESVRTNEVILRIDWKRRRYRVPLVPPETLETE